MSVNSMVWLVSGDNAITAQVRVDYFYRYISIILNIHDSIAVSGTKHVKYRLVAEVISSLLPPV